jgi:hypothetical protein
LHAGGSDHCCHQNHRMQVYPQRRMGRRYRQRTCCPSVLRQNHQTWVVVWGCIKPSLSKIKWSQIITLGVASRKKWKVRLITKFQKLGHYVTLMKPTPIIVKMCKPRKIKVALFLSRQGHIQLCKSINKLTQWVEAKKVVGKGSLFLHQWDRVGIILNRDILHNAPISYSLQFWDPSCKKHEYAAKKGSSTYSLPLVGYRWQ